MRLIKTPIEGAYVLEPVVHEDGRGYFFESYSQRTLEKLGINTVFVQDNQSFSKDKGIIRGIHFQNNPMSQVKLVRCNKVEVLDVIIDFRKNSSTYLNWFSEILSETNKKQMYVPAGCGHGFLTLTDNCELQYKVDKFYSKEHDRSVLWNDPDLGIEWGIVDPILSEKDKNAPRFADSDRNL